MCPKKTDSKTKGTGGDQRVSGFMLVTQLDEAHFAGWTDEELEARASLEGLCKVLYDRITDAGGRLKALYAIVHDSDIAEVWNENERRYEEVPKPVHVHVVGVFMSPGRTNGLTLKNLAKATGLAEQAFEKPKQGRYAIDDMLAYLIHAKDSNKAQYDAHFVKTYGGGDDYMDIWRKAHLSWERSRGVKANMRATSREKVDWLENEIVELRVTSKEQMLLDPEMFEIYARKSPRLDIALKNATDKRIALGAAAFERGEFRKTVVFLEGPGGTGKTTFAKAFCGYLEKAYGWHTKKLAAKNSLDDYDGSEVIFMDDVRAGAMSGEDWLKFLDHNNISPASARFQNKPPIAPRVIVISANQDPLEFFMRAKGVGGSADVADVDAFFRRISMQLKFVPPADYGYASIRMYSPTRSEEPYSIEVATAPNGKIRKIDGLGWWLEPYAGLKWRLEAYAGGIDEDMEDLVNEEKGDFAAHGFCFSPCGAAVDLARLVAMNNRLAFTKRGLVPETEAMKARERMYSEYMPQGKPLYAMPDMPLPRQDGDDDTSIWSEVELRGLEKRGALIPEGSIDHESEFVARYDEWRDEFQSRALRGEVPKGWRRGDPRVIPGVSLRVCDRPGDPREEGDPNEPLSYEAWCQFVEPELMFHFVSVDQWLEFIGGKPGGAEMIADLGMLAE